MVCGKGPSIGKKVKKKFKGIEKKLSGAKDEAKKVLRHGEKALSVTTGIKGPEAAIDDAKSMYDDLMEPLKSMMPQVPEYPTDNTPLAPAMDEEELRRARRRKNQGGASTILSQGNSDGLGG